jgi:hypothetical protein
VLADNEVQTKIILEDNFFDYSFKIEFRAPLVLAEQANPAQFKA